MVQNAYISNPLNSIVANKIIESFEDYQNRRHKINFPKLYANLTHLHCKNVHNFISSLSYRFIA